MEFRDEVFHNFHKSRSVLNRRRSAYTSAIKLYEDMQDKKYDGEDVDPDELYGGKIRRSVAMQEYRDAAGYYRAVREMYEMLGGEVIDELVGQEA